MLRIQPIRYGKKIIAPVGDVVSNLNFDTGDYFDDAGNEWVNVGASGAITVSTAKSKFGTHSLYSDGTEDHLTYVRSNSGVLNTTGFGLRSFTIRMWILVDPSYVQAFPNRAVMSGIASGTTQNPRILHRRDLSSPFGAGTIEMSVRTRTSFRKHVPAKNTWYHLEIGKDGQNVYYFFDGELIGSETLSAGLGTFADEFRICAYGDSAMYQFFGYIDGFNVTMDECMHTASFTPPTAPYAPPYSDI